MEPAWAGRSGQTPEEAAVFERFRAIPKLPRDEMMPAFIRNQLAPGVEPSPRPAGMSGRVHWAMQCGIHAVMSVFVRARHNGLVIVWRVVTTGDSCVSGGGSSTRTAREDDAVVSPFSADMRNT